MDATPPTAAIAPITRKASRQPARCMATVMISGCSTAPIEADEKRMPRAMPSRLSNQLCTSLERISGEAPIDVKASATTST